MSNSFRFFQTIEILTKDNQIISTGGGIVKSNQNIELLKENSVVFYLKAQIKTLVERAKKSNERPLLKVEDVEKRLENLLKEREKNYNKAHFVIEIENKTPVEIAKEIVRAKYHNKTVGREWNFVSDSLEKVSNGSACDEQDEQVAKLD